MRVSISRSMYRLCVSSRDHVDLVLVMFMWSLRDYRKYRVRIGLSVLCYFWTTGRGGLFRLRGYTRPSRYTYRRRLRLIISGASGSDRVTQSGDLTSRRASNQEAAMRVLFLVRVPRRISRCDQFANRLYRDDVDCAYYADSAGSLLLPRRPGVITASGALLSRSIFKGLTTVERSA